MSRGRRLADAAFPGDGPQPAARPAPPQPRLSLARGQVWIGRISTVRNRPIMITGFDGTHATYEVLPGWRWAAAGKKGRLSLRSLRAAYRRATDEERMRATPPAWQIDLTGQHGELRYVEVRTDAGTVRVNVGMASMATGLPSVVVEVERNIASVGRRLTPGDGDWEAEVREHALGNRTDVVLTRSN